MYFPSNLSVVKARKRESKGERNVILDASAQTCCKTDMEVFGASQQLMAKWESIEFQSISTLRRNYYLDHFRMPGIYFIYTLNAILQSDDSGSFQSG